MIFHKVNRFNLLQRKNYQKGAIIPFILIAIIPIIAMIGMSVDLGILLSAQNQQQLLTRHAALAAMSEYVANLNQCQTFPAGSAPSLLRNCAADEAVKRAERVAQVSVKIVTPKLKYKSPSSAISDFDYGAFGSSGHGFLELGVYCFDDTVATPGCAIGACGGLSPCFIPGTKTSEDNNAVRMTTSVKSNPVRHYFMKLLGIQFSDFTVSAVATLIPRNDWFGIDLSSSIVGDNYFSLGDNPPPDGSAERDGSASDFAFPLEDQTLNPNGAGPGICLPIGEISTSPNPKCQMAALPGGIFGTSSPSESKWYNMSFRYNNHGVPSPPLSIPAAPIPRYYHFRSGYKLRTVNFGARSGALPTPPISTKWMVHFEDTLPNPGGGETVVPAAPEPLFSVLGAVNGGMNTLKNRSVSVDSLSIVGFDAEGVQFSNTDGRNFIRCNDGGSNINCLSHCKNNSCLRAMISQSPKDIPGSPFRSFFRATDVLNTAQSSPDSYVNKGLFPIPLANTDLHFALFSGLLTISSNPNYRFAKNSIFIFTDGFGNCLHDVVPDGLGSITLPGASLPMNADGTGSLFNCWNTGRFIVENLNRIMDRSSVNPEEHFIQHFVKRKIAVSVALVGAAGGPHYLIKKSRSGYGCVSQSEAIESPSETLVDVTSDSPLAANRDYQQLYNQDPALLDSIFASKSAADPFYDVNRLYELVKETKGLWIPILPQAISAGGTPINFENDLYHSCGKSTRTPGAILTGPDIKINGNGAIITDVNGFLMVDNKGRLKFDPLGRTPAEQMHDALEDVLTNPFMLGK